MKKFKLWEILLIIAYQLSGGKDRNGRSICRECGMIGGHADDCKLRKLEIMVEQELTRLLDEMTDGFL